MGCSWVREENLADASTASKRPPVPVGTLLASRLGCLKARPHAPKATSAEEQQRKVDPRLDELQVVRTIGVGGSAKVVQAKHKLTGEFCALKVVPKASIFESEERIRRIADEVRIHSQLSHPFIVSLRRAFQTPTHLFMEMEFCAGGELLTHLQRVGSLGEVDARFYASEITLGVEYLHSQGVLWRDLKPENCLLDGAGHIRLADFGLSQAGLTASSRFTCFVGSAGYWSPEMASQAGHGAPHDWYSLGCLMHRILTGKLPHFAGDYREMLRRRIRGEECLLPGNITAVAQSLLRNLLEHEPSKRLGGRGRGAKEVKEHAWFSEVDWELLERREPQTCFPRFPPMVPDAQNLVANFDPSMVDQAVPRSLRDFAEGPAKDYPAVAGYEVVESFQEQESEALTEQEHKVCK
mmetsp:Transcript_5181/g.13336  ORF Transcript_5181/g.13336 Transcript_5181/m.13336 type:complete len:409 (-) Transcript_5181:187-1413(-)